ISRQISLSSLTRSMPWVRCLRASYRPLVLMSSSMPDRRRVSLAPVNTLAPSGIRSLTRLRAAAASSRISTVKPCAGSAAAARARRAAGAGSVSSVGAVGVVTVPPGLVEGWRAAARVVLQEASTPTVQPVPPGVVRGPARRDRGRRSGQDVIELPLTGWFVLLSSTTAQPPGMSGGAPTSHSGALPCRTDEGRCDRGAGETMTTQPVPGHGRPNPGLDAIMSERRQLINLAYRLLGSLAEAEDAVQEAYARWYAMTPQQQDAIESPGAWLTTVTSRIALNLLGSARDLS